MTPLFNPQQIKTRRNVMPSLSRHDTCRSGETSIRLLALSLVLAVAAPTVFAEDWDHMDGRDKDHDPTGAWLIRNDAKDSPFILTVFHKGGTVTGDIQGESAFVPGVRPPDSVVNSPQSGVWQKTGWKTFAVSVLTMEYDGNPPFALFQFDKVQYTAILSESGDRLVIPEPVISNYDPNGVRTFGPLKVPTGAHGVRIPLEILPFTSKTLSLPTSHH
jgi:hypothetical protein